MILNGIRKLGLVRNFYSSKIGQKWIENKLQTVYPHIHKPNSILDIGCGNGLISHRLLELQYNCIPLDVTNLSIIPNLKVQLYDGQQLPYEDKSMDIALLLTVLHHTKDPVKVLKETARIAQKIIIIEDIYHNRLQQYLTYGMDTLVNLGHSSMTYQNKSDSEWKKVFEQLNLTLTSVCYRPILGVFRQATYVLDGVE